MILNLDAGEYPDEPDELWALFDLVNIACGGHAGDSDSMDRVARFCAARTAPRIGAHPSYPDREGFGRRTMAIEPLALTRTIADQCGALLAIAQRHHLDVQYVKPHGALYHDATAHEPIARAVIDGAIEALGKRIIVIGPPSGAFRREAIARGLGYAAEGFADRRLRPDGSLVPRSEADALITEPERAAAQAIALARDVDTICVHADTPNAIAIARAVREAIHG